MDATPLAEHSERQISLEQLLRKTGTLTISPDEASTLAGRLARLNKQITPDERAELEQLAGGLLTDVIASVSSCADPDALDDATQRGPQALRDLVEQAVRPLAANPELRARLLEIRRSHDIVYDEVNPDTLLEAAGVDPKTRAQEIVNSWQAYLNEHRDEISAIELAYRHGTSANRLHHRSTLVARPHQETLL